MFVLKSLLLVYVILYGQTKANFLSEINGDTSSFFLGTWYTTGLPNPPDASTNVCCLPDGTITFNTDPMTNNLTLSASNWIGEQCVDFNITNSTVFSTLQPDLSSFTEAAVDDIVFFNDTMGYTMRNLDADSYFDNGTQRVLFNFGTTFYKASMQRWYICLQQLSLGSTEQDELLMNFGYV